jgi:NNP family nitrate/nitrite transporter-like MFS transporter
MFSRKQKQWSVLSANTVAFAVNFAVWTLFSILGIKIKQDLGLSATQFGVLIATPILTGSISRLPLGILTDLFGGRRVFTILMIWMALPSKFWNGLK